MRAAEYRKHAEEMTKCARAARSEDEREQYLTMARAWSALAEGAERGLEPDRTCDGQADS